MHGQAEHFILEAELFFLELVKKDVVGVGSLLFLVDPRLKSGMLLFESLDVCLFHRASFPFIGVTAR